MPAPKPKQTIKNYVKQNRVYSLVYLFTFIYFPCLLLLFFFSLSFFLLLLISCHSFIMIIVFVP